MFTSSLQQITTAAVAHVDAAGWVALVALVWRAGRKVGQIEDRLELLSTNHLPHLQVELENLRADIRTLWQSVAKKG